LTPTAVFDSGVGCQPTRIVEEPIVTQGDEWDAYVTLDTYDRDERGINPQVARHGGDGVLVVVVGATTHQGGRESRPQGEGAQVAGHRRAGRYA
jgi:hypothetical protein